MNRLGILLLGDAKYQLHRHGGFKQEYLFLYLSPNKNIQENGR